jgi:hypothetical protein
VDHTGRQVEVLPPQRRQLAAAQPRVERRRPQHAVLAIERRQELLSLLRRRDVADRSSDRRHLKPAGWVLVDFAAGNRATVDRPKRHHARHHRRRRDAGRHEVVHEALQVHAADVIEAAVAELGQDTQPEILLVGPDCGRLVEVA